MNNMKTLVVLYKHNYGVEERGQSFEYNYFYKTLKKMSKETELFDLGNYTDKKEQIHKDLIAVAEKFKPDYIYFTFIYSNDLELKTLDYIKKKYLTINWFCDDNWRFEELSAKYAKHFSYCITTDKYTLVKYKKIGYKDIILSQYATRPIENINFDKIQYKYDVSFIGSSNLVRKWFIDKIKEKGINVICFGHGWSNNHISFKELQDVTKRSKINLNLTNSMNYDARYIFSGVKPFIGTVLKLVRLKQKKLVKNSEQIKARNFEINGYGGFQLTNFVSDLGDYFELEKEIAAFQNIDDLIKQIHYYLENEDLRKEIMMDGYNKVIKKDTYEKRFKEIFKKIELNELKKKKS